MYDRIVLQIRAWYYSFLRNLGPVTVQDNFGIKMRLYPFDKIPIKKLLTRENYKYEFSMYDRYAPGKVVVDAGANIGIHAVYLSRLATTVYAFEPVPQTFAWLEETIRLNKRTNIVPVNVALGDASGTVEMNLFAPGQSAWDSIHIPDIPADVANAKPVATRTVSITTLDAFAEQNNIDTIGFMKMDVEGHELAVLRGGAQASVGVAYRRIFVRSRRMARQRRDAPVRSTEIIRLCHDGTVRSFFSRPELLCAEQEDARNMRILVLQDDFPPRYAGGAGLVAYALAQGFQKGGHEVLVVTTSRKKEEEGITRVEGLTVHTLATAYDTRFRAYVSLWNIPVVAKVEKILADFKPDVVHAHNVHAYLSYGSLVAAKRSGARVILTCHDVMTFNYQKLTDFIDPNDLSVPATFNYRVSAWRQFRTNRFRYNPLRNLVIRRILRKNVDRIVAVSDALTQALADNGIGNAQTIHNGIEVREWQEPEEAVRTFKQQHRIGDAAILFSGRLSGVKGALKILEALALITRTVPEAQLVVAGQKDAYTEKMLAYARTLGVADKIVFTGLLSGHALHLAYHAASVVAFPSLCFDTFGLVNIEAMACHKPVVATCFGGSREIVQDGITGYIVNPFNVPTLAAKLRELLVDTEKNAAFGEAGYERVVESFSLMRQEREYEQLFSSPPGKGRGSDS